MNQRLVAGMLLLIALFLRIENAQAEPYLAVETGLKCNVCHFNPTGGGLRTEFGVTYLKLQLPAETLDNSLMNWTGKITDSLRAGGDLREDWTRDSAPNTPTTHSFSLQQFRLYGELTLIRDRLEIYIDEQVAPNGSQNEEAYILYGSRTNGFYFKGGQFYLPFGWRLQDQTAFVREATAISMATPDKGVEIGYERPSWSAQIDLTNGIGNANSGSGYQVTSQVAFVKPIWRIGVAGSFTQAVAGDRRVAGLFAGLKTGPVAWLAEADLVRDDSFPDGRTLTAGLFEADWQIRRGHNLKLTAEYYDPDRSVAEDQQTRYSIVYEYTPIPFLQFRAGYRHYFGIPQNNTQNQQLELLELHGFF